MKNLVKTIENDEAFLRQISRKFDFEKDNLDNIVSVLDEYCKNSNDIIAIAAVQLGIPVRILYLKQTKLEDLDNKNVNEGKVMINPVIKSRMGFTKFWEACASCLDNIGLVSRPYKMELEYYDIYGNKITEKFEGFISTILSHEIDHMNGILHIDVAEKIVQMSAEERRELRKREPYQVIRKDGEFK